MGIFNLLPCNWEAPKPKWAIQKYSQPESSKTPLPIPYELSVKIDNILKFQANSLGNDRTTNECQQVNKWSNPTDTMYDINQIMPHIDTINEQIKNALTAVQSDAQIDPKIFKGLMEHFLVYNTNVRKCFASILTSNPLTMLVDNCPVGVKFMNVSQSKILLIQIPEEIYNGKDDGYRYLADMINTLQESGIVVISVPNNINIVNITEDDLKKVDLFRIAKLKEKTY